MAALKGSKTENNLKDAFAGESQANRRYLYFAQKADVEGYNDVAAVFRSTAEGETGHAHGHLEYLEEVGDPATGEPIGATEPISTRRSRARPTNIPTCIRAWRTPPARKASTRSPTGSRPWPRPRSRMPAASRRRWTRLVIAARARKSRQPLLRPSPASGGGAAASVESGGLLNREIEVADDARRQPRRADPSHHRRGRIRISPIQPSSMRKCGASIRHLPWLPPLLQSVRFVSAAVRSDRQFADRGTGRASKRTEFEPVVDACTLCDMCFMTKCPYVPPHPFNLDIPASAAARTAPPSLKRGKTDFTARQLGETDRNGSLAGAVAPLANWATRPSASR